MNLFQNYTKFFDNLGQVVSENTYQDWQKIFRRALSYSKESGNLSERCFWPRIHSEILHNLALNSNTNSDYDQLIQSAVDSCLASSTAAGQLTMKARNSLDLKGEQFWHRQRAESLYRATEYIQDKETLHEILERATAFYLSSASIAGQLILQSDERKDMADSYLWRTVRGRLYLKAAEIASHDRGMDEYLSRALVDFQSAEGLAGLIVKHALEHEDLEGQQEWRRKRAEMCSSAADLMHGSERSKKNSDAVNLYKAAASLAGQLAIRARDANRLEEVLRWHTERAISSEKAAKFVDDIDSVNELQKVAYDYYSASAAIAGQLFLEARSAGDIQQQQSLLEVRAERTVDAARMAKTKESMRFLNDSARGYFSGAADLANELVFRARNANKIDDVQHWLCKYSSMLLRAASLTSDDSSKCDNFVKKGLVGIDLMYDYRLSGL